MTGAKAWLFSLLLCQTVLADSLLRLHPAMFPAVQVEALSSIVEEEAQIRLVSGAGNDDPLEALSTGSADLAIAENTRPFIAGVRTVLPIYQAVVHIAARTDSSCPSNGAGTERPPIVELAGAAHTAKLVAELLFQRAKPTEVGFRVWRESSDVGEPDLTLYVGPIAPENTDWFRDGFTLQTLSCIDAAGAEFFTEGVIYLYPQLRPTRIPALTYRLPGNKAGIDTLGVDMLLLTRQDADAATIYRLVRTLLEQKPQLAAIRPQLFRWLREDFSRDDLSFPLHQGARDYFAREEPGFLERHAETLNLIVYVVALAITGLLGLARWRARQRKERIDRFYERLLSLRRRLSGEKAASLLAELDVLEEDAYELLMAERLAADESFRIFTDLAARLRSELQRDMERL